MKLRAGPTSVDHTERRGGSLGSNSVRAPSGWSTITARRPLAMPMSAYASSCNRTELKTMAPQSAIPLGPPPMPGSRATIQNPYEIRNRIEPTESEACM